MYRTYLLAWYSKMNGRVKACGFDLEVPAQRIADGRGLEIEKVN